MTDDLARWTGGLVEGRRGTLVQQKRDRRVWRVEEDGQIWFAKRGTGGRREEIRREARNARRLEDLGIGARVLASGASGGSEWLVTEDAGAPLAVALREAAGRRRTLLRVAGAVRRLHGSGLAFPDLSSEHVRIGRDHDVALIDAARLERLRAPAPVRKRARDLANLVFTCHPARLRGVTRTDWVRSLRDATGCDREGLRELCALVDRGVLRLAERTRWRRRHEATSAEFERARGSGEAPESLSDEDAARWSFERLLRGDDMPLVRRLDDRENRTVPGPGGRPRWFVKVFPPTRTGWSPAMREVCAIDAFRRARIPVNALAAYAEDLEQGSMAAVRAVPGEPLDDLLRRGVTRAERRELAVETARIWRRMRECGLRHRDAYACHVFAARGQRGFELHLIDLTRAGVAPFPRERWFVKDAAALWHGCPRPPVTRTDAVRWLREYFRVPKLTAAAKRFARRVAAKERRIAARQERKTRRGKR